MGRLVPARAEQPCGRRAAEQRNELTASKFTEFHSILEQAPSPRADEQPFNGESQGGSLLSTARTAWPVSAINEGAADTHTADAASNAVQLVDPNEVNELDRAASVESSWLNYLLWTLGAALAAAFAMWFFSRMRSLFGRRTANAAEPLMK